MALLTALVTPAPLPLSTRWFEGLAGLQQLRDDWLALAYDAQLFARYEWHLAAATHLLSVDQSIWFCRIADAEGRPVCIVPAVTATANVRPFGDLSALTLGTHDHQAAFDFPLAHSADTGEVGKAMLNAFEHLPFHWRVISWPRVMADSNAAKIAIAIGPRLTDITPGSQCSTFCTAIAPSPVEGLEVFSLKSSKLKRTLAQHSRRLSLYGPVRIRMASDENDIDGFLKEFLRIESSGWKGVNGTRTAIALVPEALAFYNLLIAESNPAFEADIALLYCGERAIAGQFLVRTARWEHVYKIGYDEEFAECSPGQVLLQLSVERAKSSPAIDRVSLVTGFDWMTRWAPIQETTLHVNIFRHMWRPLVEHVGRFVLTEFRKTRRNPMIQRTLRIVLHTTADSTKDVEQPVR